VEGVVDAVLGLVAHVPEGDGGGGGGCGGGGKGRRRGGKFVTY
jgi:hypothetical protein